MTSARTAGSCGGKEDTRVHAEEQLRSEEVKKQTFVQTFL